MLMRCPKRLWTARTGSYSFWLYQNQKGRPHVPIGRQERGEKRFFIPISTSIGSEMSNLCNTGPRRTSASGTSSRMFHRSVCCCTLSPTVPSRMMDWSIAAVIRCSIFSRSWSLSLPAVSIKTWNSWSRASPAGQGGDRASASDSTIWIHTSFTPLLPETAGGTVSAYSP